MRYSLFLVLMLVGGMGAWCQVVQQSSIKGRLKSAEDDQPLAGARIALLLMKDSSLAALSGTDNSGAFMLKNIDPGKYIVGISYIGYRALMQDITISQEGATNDLGIIKIQRTGVDLRLVEVIGIKPPMVLKRDTIEFNADYFHTRENAVLEELFKKLPGVQVDGDGTVRVNGQPVKKLLIDGRQFGGDDLQLITRNLTADLINKIQFIDRQQNWVQFQRAGQGPTEKAVNITIKENRKGEYNGQIGAGLGTHDHFAAKGQLTGFSEDQQLFILGAGTSINGYEDDGAQGRISVGGNSEIRRWTIGGNYNRDLGRKMKLTSTYTMNDNNVLNQRKSERQNLLPDTTWYYSENTRSEDINKSNALAIGLEYSPDTMHRLSVVVNADYVSGSKFEENGYTSLGGEKQLVNTGTMLITDASKVLNFSGAVHFGKRFRKAGRTFSIKLGIAHNTNDREGFNRSDNVFVQPAGGTFKDTIDQRNDINNLNRSVSLSLTYTEPLFRDHYLELTNTYTRRYETSDRATYDYNPSGKTYDRRNDSLSNAFANRSSAEQAAVRLVAQKPHYDYHLGVNVLFTGLDNNNITGNARVSQRAINVFPSAGFNYNISSGKRLQFAYTGSPQQPTAAQLQPVPDNSNPLYIHLGNPHLEQAFNHSFNAGYNALNPATMRTFFAGLNTTIITQKIINAAWFDSLGRQLSQPLNVNGAFNMNIFISNSFPLRKLQTAINSTTILAFDRDIGYINGKEGDIRTLSATQNMAFNYHYKEVFSLAVNAGLNYNRVRYSMQKDNSIQYFNYTLSFDANVRLPLGFRTGANTVYMRNNGLAAGYNQDVVLLNAFVAKSLFKRKKGLVRLQAFDLLNRNAGVSRTVGQQYIEDVQTTVAQRLFLMSFTYFLRK